MGISDKLPGMKPGSTVRNIVVGVVYFFVIIGVLGAMGGPDETSSDDTAPESDADTDEMEDQDEQSSDDSSEDSSDAENSGSGDSGESSSESSSNTYSIRVQYSGDWSGSIAAGGSSRSVDGSGEQTFDVEG